MAAQDDVREREMRQLFNLVKPEEFGRSDIDAVLELKGPSVPDHLRGRLVKFELKSATGGRPDISTVRDFGLHYIEKWRHLHWLFGIYGRNAHGDQILQYCLYGSPEAMRTWFDEKAAYIAPDVALAEHVPSLMGDATLTSILGDAQTFSRSEARRLMKSQYRAADYLADADIDGERYSRGAMLAMLRKRCEYVIRRGSTLNNPHISPAYFAGWPEITEDHAATLRESVIAALLKEESE